MAPHETPISFIKNFRPSLDLLGIFDTAQKDPTSHQRLMKRMITMYNELDNKSPFIAEFLQCLTCCLPIMEKHPAVERALDFAAKYCILHDRMADQGEVLLLSVYEYLFQNHSRKDQGIRYRVSEFINRLLNGMGEQATLDDDIFRSIASCMLDRLQDRTPSIRSQAVMALQRLQEPTEPRCPIIKAFLFHMEADPSSEVRAKVIANIAVTTRTLPHILARLNDVKDTVRKETYRTLSRLKMQRYSIRQRQDIFRRGLNDNSDFVKNYVLNHLLPLWFKNHVESNYIEFLKLLDIETFEKEAGTMLNSLFKREPIHSVVNLVKVIEGPDKLVPPDALTPEVAFLWRTIIHYLNRPPSDVAAIDEDLVNTIIPELTHFTKYMSEVSLALSKEDSGKESFILLQLLEISSFYSLSDEMGRVQLRALCVKLLADDKVTVQLVPTIAKLFQGIIPDVKDRLSAMAEIISDIREPMPEEPMFDTTMEEDEDGPPVADQSNDLSVSDELMPSQADKPTDGNQLNEGREMRNDATTLIKCLTIVIEFLKCDDVNKVDATLHTLHETFLKSCFEVEQTKVVCLALDAVALLCIMSKELSKQNFVNFCVQLSDDATCVSALEAVFDIILMHGFELVASALTCPPDDARQNDFYNFSDDETFNNTTLKYFISLLTTLLSSSCQNVRNTAVLGLSKLLLSGQLNSHTVLSRLILIWFSPASAEEAFVRQALGIFFKVYSNKKLNAGDVILKALIPTVRAIQDAEYDDPVSQIDPMNVIKLLVTLLRHDILSPPDIKEGSYHCKLAFICLKEILLGGCKAGVIAKALSILEFQQCDNVHLRTLNLLAEKACKKIKKSVDKKAIKLLQEFLSKCKTTLNLYENTVADRIKDDDVSSVNESVADSELSGFSRLSVSMVKSSDASKKGRVMLPSDSDDDGQPPSCFKVPYCVDQQSQSSSPKSSSPGSSPPPPPPLETSDFSFVQDVTSPKRKGNMDSDCSSSFCETPMARKRLKKPKPKKSLPFNTSTRSMTTRSTRKKK